MTPPLPPRPSPYSPELEPEEPSGVRKLTVREARLLMQKQEEARAQHEELQRITAESAARARRTKNFIWATVGIVISTVIITASTLVYAQSAIDGGAARAVDPVSRRVSALEKNAEKTNAIVQDTSLRAARTETMVEMLLRADRIKPPPPVDGGQ